jgi:aminopeptidase N
LYNARKNGRDAMLYELYERARHITSIPDDVNPIVRRTYNDPDEMFGYLAYPKGGWVLHMLRSQLGEDLYRRCVRTYLERHQYGNVTTEDLRVVIEELSGRSYDQFFDQWLYHAHHPELEVNYSWDEPAKLARLSIRQVQKIDQNVLLFNFPLLVRFKGQFGVADRPIQVTKKEEDFYFPLVSAPELVRLDPEYTLLARIQFGVPNGMLKAQLKDERDVVGRLLAIEQLSGRKDRETVERLREVLNQDAFYGARVEASKALRAIHTDDALEALLASTNQKDARARRQVIDDIGGFYREAARERGRETLANEKNPAILSTAIRDLAGYATPEIRDLLLKHLNSTSFRNELADAAIGGMRSQDDPVYIAPLLETLSKREAEFTTHGFAQGLTTLAYLARNEERKDAVREFLTGHLNHKKQSIQVAGINALGTLRDPKALAALEKFATASRQSRERAAAERAVADLRAARKPVDDFKNLRQEVLDLQKANRELRKDLEDLKTKVAARSREGAPPSPTPAAAKKKPLVQPKSK